MEGTTGQNLFGASDSSIGMSPMGNEVAFEDMPKEFIKLFTQAEKIIDRMAKRAANMVDDVKKATGDVGKDQPGAGKLGLGSFTRTEKMVGLGLGAMAVGSTYMSMAPNTMAAVTQRLGADTYAGVSGMSSRQAILQANRQVGGGATSAMGPTMAASALYGFGYTANSLSSRNIMSQLAGMSAMSGMSNEQAAAAMGGMNGMNYLRLGIRIRDAQGNLRPNNEIVNQLFNTLTRGGKLTKEQAAAGFLNPGGKGYQTLMAITGGDRAQMQMFQSGLMLRASKGSAITSADMRDPNKTLDLLGVDKSSPYRANFRYNSSENRKLAATEQGLVGGYDASLRTAASLNDAYSKMADILGPVNDGLMTLKGILQTFPQAGGMGGTVSGLASMGTTMAGYAIQGKMISNFIGGSGAGTKGAGGLFKGGGGKAFGTGMALAVGGTALKGNAKHGSARSRLGTAAQWAGTASILNVFGPEIGVPAMAIAGLLGGIFGGESTETMNTPTSGSSNPPSKSSQTGYASPVPKGTPVSSPFGRRKGGMVNGKKISSNHKGIDFATPENTPITALANGTVIETGRKGDWGNYVLLRHSDGTSSRYAHLNAITASRGQKVSAGTILGKSGGAAGKPGSGNSTGPHLHFEYMNASGVRIDPAPFLKGVKASDPHYSWTGYHHTNFISNSNNSAQLTFSDLQSPTLAALLSSAVRSGEPISWSDVQKKAGRSGIPTGSEILNDTLDKTSGDTHGMAGGSRAGLMRMLYQQGFRGKALHTAFAVALAESGGRADAIGDVRLQDHKWGPSIGAFQIRSLKNWKAYNDPYRDGVRLKNATFNSKAAFEKSNHGKSFKPWSTFTSGSFVKFLDDAQVASQKAGVGGEVGNSVNLPAGINHSPTRGGSTSASFNSKANINMNIKMEVNIARSGVAEAEHMFKVFSKRLKESNMLDIIGGAI